MRDKQREIHVAKIRTVESAMMDAGSIHKHDLSRQLKRLRKELAEYDKLRRTDGNYSE